MPFIKADEIKTLIEIENHLGETEDWSEHTTKLWYLIEELLERKKKDAEKSKLIMREKRKIDKNYGRNYKKSEQAKQHEKDYHKKYYLTVTKPNRQAKKGKNKWKHYKF